MNSESTFDRYDQYKRQEEENPFKMLIGAVLILIGVLILLWVFFHVVSMIKNPAEEFKAFLELMPDSEQTFANKADGNELSIPPAVFQYLSYGFAILLLFISVSIGSAFLTGGITLLTYNMKALEKTFKNAMLAVKYKTGNLSSFSKSLEKNDKSEKE